MTNPHAMYECANCSLRDYKRAENQRFCSNRCKKAWHRAKSKQKSVFVWVKQFFTTL